MKTFLIIRHNKNVIYLNSNKNALNNGIFASLSDAFLFIEYFVK